MGKLVLYIAIFFATSLMANGINWEKDFKSGVEAATKADKPILFIFSSHACKYCVLLEETTFADATVIDDVNKNFISIISYADENDYTPRELWRPGTPAIWFLYPDGAPMYKPLMGAVDKTNFLKVLTIVKDGFAKNPQKKNK